MKLDNNKPLDEQMGKSLNKEAVLSEDNAAGIFNKEQRLILIAEAVLQNVIDLTANFVELLNELFDDCGHEAGRDKKEQIIADEVFGQALGKRESQNIWGKDFGRHNKSGRVCKDYGFVLRGKDVLKDYSKLLQGGYRAKGDKSYSGYKSDNGKQLLYGYRNQLSKGLQLFKRMQEYLPRAPRALKRYEISRKPAGSDGYRGSYGKLKSLYFNHQDNKAYIKGGNLHKSLDAYFE